MDKLNIMHKFFALAVVALFAINQAMLTQIQQNMSELLPELRIKNEVAKCGTGKNAQVIAKLRDDTTVEGYISQISDDSFTITNPKTREATRLAYNIVEKIEELETASGLKLAIRFRTLAIAVKAAMGQCGSALAEEILE